MTVELIAEKGSISRVQGQIFSGKLFQLLQTLVVAIRASNSTLAQKPVFQEVVARLTRIAALPVVGIGVILATPENALTVVTHAPDWLEQPLQGGKHK